MHKLEELKKKLIEKMERMYEDHPDLSGSVIENIDIMAHAVKNLCKICEEEEYSSRGSSNAYFPMVFARGSYEGSNESYGGEAYRKRDSMGRFSREGSSRESSRGSSRDGYSRGMWETVDKIEDLIREAPDEQTRQELQRIAGRLRNG